jgi:P4 family phage/plasmid primase-like protien
MGKLVEAFDEAARKLREKEKSLSEKQTKTESSLAPKQILDKWASNVVPISAIWINKEGVAQIDATKSYNYNDVGYKGNEVLWKPPKNCIRLEFEDTPEKNKKYIEEIESVLKAEEIDYCISGHNGKSDYINIFNIKKIPMSDNNQKAKMLYVNNLMNNKAKDMLDRTNLGWTYSPIIGHPHWKPKYNGTIHKLIRGKNPLEHENKFPTELLKKLKKINERNINAIKETKRSSKWVEDFLLNYCCSNLLPAGARHLKVEKNLAAFLFNKKEKETYKESYYKAQGRTHDSMRTWESAIVNGEYTNVSAGELTNFIKEYNLPYDIPNEYEKDNNIISGKVDLFFPNKEIIAEEFYKQQPYFYDDIGFFWFWNNRSYCYEMENEYQLMNKLKKIADQRNFQVTTKTFWGEIIRSLKLIGTEHHPEEFKKTWVQFGKTIYDYKNKENFIATPKYFNVNPIKWELGTSKETPTIDKLFTEWVNKENILTLKQTLALAVLQDYPLHRMIYLFGKGLNGKGVFQRFITEFIGKHNVCSSNLKKLIKSNFEVSKLYKKLVCLIGETDFNVLENTSMIKGLTGQDLVSAEFKGKNSFDFENNATIFVASNSLPITLDKTIGFYRRPMIIDFPNSFEEGKDPLKNIPENEYKNLCNQLLDIIPKLIETGKFDKDGNIEQRRLKYEEKSNPLSIFLKANYEICTNNDIPFFEFYDKFNSYCEERGYRELSKINVSKLLEEDGYHTEKKDIKIGNVWKKWVYILDIKEKEDRSFTEINTENDKISNPSTLSNSECIQPCIKSFDITPSTMSIMSTKSKENIPNFNVIIKVIRENDTKNGVSFENIKKTLFDMKYSFDDDSLYDLIAKLCKKAEIFSNKVNHWKMLE